MSVDQLYRELILDHYKNPRGHGRVERPDAEADGQNPLCGDEISMTLRLGVDGETIEEVRFEGHGCAISQAATSMLIEEIVGKKASDVAALSKDAAPLVAMMEESGTPLTPIRLKCALLGLGVLKVALHKSAGTPLPEEWAGADEIDFQ
ncbi:MAG: Fe-S cluster assembly sulfur transfer protein SufU [Gaiellaceae bacterium]